MGSFRGKELKACPGRELSKDRISELPDDVIIYILSLLSMKEAGRTSVLSRRWRYVWAYIPVLNFKASSDALYMLMAKDPSLREEKPRFLSWVNEVVGSYKRSTIDEFGIRFDLDMTSEYSIHNWIKFVMEKRVKRLELDFFNGGVHNNRYAFPNVSPCNSLTCLKLACVDITGEVLQNLLKICPGLEYLSVKRSESLVNLEVVGATLGLKYLEISCGGVKYIEICAPNLVSFSYSGPKINMPLKRSPKLAKLSIGSWYAEYLTKNFLELSSCIFQLETLKLSLLFCRIKNVMNYVDQFPICTRLRELELVVSPTDDEDLFCFATLIRACPFLRKFVLELDCYNPELKRKLLKVEACPHYHLKIVEIAGFVGHAIDLEFIIYLVESSVALEKIVIDPREECFLGTPWELEEKKRVRTVRKEARKLLAKLKPGVDLIIL